MTQALARTEPRALLQAVRQNPIEAITEQYDTLAQVANVTFPATAIDNIPPMHKPSPALVMVDMAEKSKDTYFITGEQRGLSKHVLMKMLTAAGCSWQTRKLTPESDMDHIRYQAVVSRRLPDGLYQQGEGSKSWHWEKCREEFIRKALAKPKNGESEEQAEARGLNGARQYLDFADEQTETKALLRAARAILNLQTSYTPEQLAKPFLFLRIVLDPDMSDPEVKAAYINASLGATKALYAPPADFTPRPELPAAFPEPGPEAEEEGGAEDAQFAGEEDGDFKPDAEAVDPEVDRLALEQKVAALAKASSSGGIGKQMGAVLEKFGVRTWVGASLDTLQAIYDDAMVIKGGA
jgi:hypothetical protein